MERQSVKRVAERGQPEQNFAQLEAEFTRAGRIEDLIRLYEARSKEVSAQAEAAQALARAADLARDRIKNPARAEDLYRRALLFQPASVDALKGLRGVYEQRQDFAATAEVLERLAEGGSGEEAAGLYLKAAELYEQKLSRRDRAILCLQHATRANPKDRSAYQRIRALLYLELRFSAVYDSLERERSVNGDSNMADQYAALAEKLVDDPTEHELARRAVAAALRIEGQHQRTLKVQRELAKFEHGWRERVKQLRASSLEERDRKAAARTSLLVAKLYAWYDAENAAKVKEALDRCFLLWPAMPDALRLIERIAERRNEVPLAVTALEKMAGETKDRAAQAELWVRVGTLKLTRTGDPDGALEAFEKATAADASRADAASLACELLLDHNRAQDAVAHLERHLATVKDRVTVVSLRLRLSELCSSLLKDPAAARVHLESALKTDPLNAQAAFSLSQQLAVDDQLEAIEPMLDLALCAPRPVSERVAFCENVAMLYEEREDHRKAFALLSRALVLEPTRPLLLSTVVENATRGKVQDELAVALRKAAQAAPEPAAQEIWRNLAQLLQTQLSRPQEAAAAWEEVLRRSPEDREATAALAALKSHANGHNASAGDARLALEAEARKLEGSAADPGALSALYRKILALAPNDVAVLKRLGASCAAMGQWDEVAKVAARLSELSETPADRAEWRSRLAQLYAERLGKKDEAAALYLGLLAEDVASAAVVGGLERLATQGIRQAEISRALAPIYAKAGDYQRQVASLLVQLSTAQSKAEQKELLALLANTQEKHLADARAAFELILRGLSIDPGDEAFRTEAVRLARVLSSHQELSRALVDLSGHVEQVELANALLQQAAEVAEEGGAVEDAAAALNAALKRTPDEPEVLSRLVRLYVKANRYSDCDQVLRRRILVAAGDEKAQLYLQLAQVSDELSRPSEGAQAIQEAIKSGADEAAHLPKLCELLERAGRMLELSSTLGRMIELAEKAGDKDKAARLSLKRAQVLEASLGDRAAAVKNYADILATRPTDPDALAALEHMLGDPTCREESARALVPAYEAVKDHRKQVAALDVIAEAAQDTLEKVLALKQAAYIHLHHLRQPELAFATLARALKLSPTDNSVRNAARQAAEDGDSLDSYAEVLAELLEGQLPSAAKIAIHRDLSDVFERKLDNRAKAIEHLRALIELDPKNTEALKSLQRLHRANEEWKPLVEVIEKLGAVVTDHAEKISLWREAAFLHEQKLEDKDSAAARWRQIAERDPLDKEAASALDRLYSALDKPPELAFALELRRNQEGQSPQGRELAFRLAKLRQDRLEDAAGALQLYRQILTEDPGHVASREALEAWARESSPQSAAALEILDPLLAQLGDHARRVSLREARMATARREEKGRLSAEIRAIFERDLGQPELAFMAALKSFAEGVDREGLRSELERLAKVTGSFEDLAEIYESAAGELPDGDAGRGPLLRRGAELREQLGQAEEAVRLWKDLLALVPQDRQALDSLGRLYERSKNAKSLSEVYAKKAQLAQGPAERHELLLKAGEAYEAAGEDGPAIEALRSALAIKKSVGGLQALDRLFGKLHKFEEQADVLDQLAQASPDEQERKGYLHRRAQLLEKVGEPGEALRAYAQLLELAPADPAAVAGLERLLQLDAARSEAARLLEPHYRSTNENKKLVEVLDVRLQMAPPEGRYELISEIATLREALGHKPLAFAARLRAFVERPEDKAARDELERLAADTGSFEELASVYEEQLQKGVSDALAEDLWRRLAVVYIERLARPDLAARAWTEVAYRAPEDRAVLDNLARLYRKTNAFKELAQVMRRQVELEPSAEEQVQLLFELARLAEETLLDKALAAETYEQILSRKPDEQSAIKFLGKVLSESERYPELAALMAKEIQLANARGASEEALELEVRLGRLKLARLSDPRGALQTFQEVLKKRPAHPSAVGALEEMARSDSPLRGEAGAALEPIFSTLGDHMKLVQMLESQASTEKVAQERAALYRKVAEIYGGPMANPEMAFVSATKALREIPDDPRSLDLCLALVEPASATEELESLLTEVATKAADDKARGALFRTLGKLQTRSGSADEAVASWKRVLQLSPSDPEALENLARLLSKLSRPQELFEVLRRQLSLTEEPPKRAELLFQLGCLQDEALKDGLGALATFRRLLELRPDDPRALEKMDELCQKQERWPELADVLARRIKLLGWADPDGEDVSLDDDDKPPAAGPPAPAVTQAELLELKFRLAHVRETRLLDRSGAVDLYAEVLGKVPAHAGALERLSEMVGREPQNLQATLELLKAFRTLGDTARLAQLLESRAQISPDAMERKALLEELATVREGQGEPELTYLALYRAFKEDPNDRALRERLEGAAEAAKTFDELATAYEEELPRIAETYDAARICLRLGELLDQRLHEAARAVECYEKARTLDPSTAKVALTALDRLYNDLNRPKEMAQVLQDLIALADDPREQVGLLFRLGQLFHERLDEVDSAVASYEKVLELDPKHLPSTRMLEQLYEAAANPDKLYRVLKLQRDLVQGPERERILGKMAKVSAEGLSDVAHSIDIYRELLGKNPRNEQAFAALEGLLEKAERAEDLRDLLAKKLSHTVDPRELVRLNEKLGRVLLRMLKQPEQAVPYFKAALDRDARHKVALESLRDCYDALDKKDDLVVVLRRLVPLQEAAEGVKALRVRLAEVLASMGRREEALDAGRRALEVAPHEAADLDRLHAIFLTLKAYPDAAKSLELRAEVELGQDLKDKAVATLFTVADLWRQVAQKPEGAGPVLEKVLQIDPPNRRAYEEASRLYSEAGDWRAYAQVVDHYLPHLVSDEEKIVALKELTRVHEHKLSQKDTAFLAVCRALQLDPADHTIRDEVERLADETRSYDELSAVYGDVADSVPKGPLAERLYLTLARVHDQKLDDPAAAEGALRKILEFDPTNALALETLAGMFARREMNKEYIVALEQKLEASGAIEQRTPILKEIAKVFEERLEDPAEAAHALRRAIELNPDLETFQLLIGLFRRQQAWADVASALLQARDLAPTPEEKARTQIEVAQLYERELSNDEGAIEAYRATLEFDPGSQEALDSLERLYTKTDNPSELLAVYERQVELTPDYREKVKILFKSASIWEDKFQNLANADACVEAVLNLDPQNLQAIKTLERLRKAEGKWDELVDVLERHLALGTPEEQADLLVEMGDVFHQQLKQVDRAVAMYHRAMDLNQDCRPAMHALGTLYERSGNWPFALDMLQKEAVVAGNTPEAVELYHRMGKINEDMLMDHGGARGCYQQALAIDPAYLPSLRALKGLLESGEDWDAYEKTLIQEAEQTEDPDAKAKALLEVGRYYLDRKEDREAAAMYFEQALRLAPDSYQAARALADIYIGREDWANGERMMDVVCKGLTAQLQGDQDGAGAKELCRQLYRLGYVAEKLGKKEKALPAYERAYQLDATYLPALEGLGNLLTQVKRYEEALKVYQTILIHHRDDLTDLEVVEIYWQLGDIHHSLKQYDRAQNHFEKALAIDPGHEPSLRALVALADAANKHDKAAEYRQGLMQVLDGDTKFATCVELGILAKEKLNDPYMAIDAYVQAHRLQPDQLQVMDALFSLYKQTRQGQKAAEILERMIALPALKKDPARLKRVHFALGEIARDELKDFERAARHFNAALDVDQRYLEAFSAIEAMLGQQKLWKPLEENYARMIQRLPKSEETHAARMTLWKAMGDLYLKVLKQPENALMAYQVVSAGVPDDAQIQEAYADLAAKHPGHEDKAVDGYRRALPATNNPGKVVAALAELAARRKDYDLAYLAAQVMSGLIGEPGASEKEILVKLTPYAKKREVAQRALTDRMWQLHLFHPKVRGPLSELMGIVAQKAWRRLAVPLAQYQLNPKKHRIDVASAQEYQLHHLRYVAQLLGMSAVELYSPFLVATRERLAKRSNDPAPEPMVGLEVCHADPVCLKAGGKYFGETGQKEVYYLLGRAMAMLRPELMLCQRLSAEDLEAMVQAAISLSVERFRFTADPRSIEAKRKILLESLDEPSKISLARVVREYVKTATPNDLRNYSEGAELTAVRAGLFVAGEVEPVKKMVLGESGAAYRVPARSKIRDLMVFAISEDLHTLRAAVGTNIEVSARK